MKLPDDVKVLVDHNRYLFVALLLGLLLVGCVEVLKPTTTSPFTGERVTRCQLDAEVEIWKIKVVSAYQDLAQKEAFLSAVMAEITPLVTATPYGGLAMSVLGLLTAGTLLDSRRKDARIEILKAASQKTTESTS